MLRGATGTVPGVSPEDGRGQGQAGGWPCSVHAKRPREVRRLRPGRSRKEEVAFYEARGQVALSQSRAQQAFRRGPERGRQPLSRVLGCALSPEGSRRVSCPERVSPQVPGLKP